LFVCCLFVCLLFVCLFVCLVVVVSQEVPETGLKFKRAFFKSEIHSREYTAVRTSCSHNVAIEYDTGTHFATVERFFLFNLSDQTVRVAEVTIYTSNPNPSASGLPRIDLKKTYSRAWRFVDVTCLDRKVIFAPGSPTVVLTIPRPSNR